MGGLLQVLKIQDGLASSDLDTEVTWECFMFPDCMNVIFWKAPWDSDHPFLYIWKAPNTSSTPPEIITTATYKYSGY